MIPVYDVRLEEPHLLLPASGVFPGLAKFRVLVRPIPKGKPCFMRMIMSQETPQKRVYCVDLQKVEPKNPNEDLFQWTFESKAPLLVEPGFYRHLFTELYTVDDNLLVNPRLSLPISLLVKEIPS